MNSIQRKNTTQQLVLDIFEMPYAASLISVETGIEPVKIYQFIEGEVEATEQEFAKLLRLWCRLDKKKERKEVIDKFEFMPVSYEDSFSNYADKHGE